MSEVPLSVLEPLEPYLKGWVTAPHDQQALRGWYVNPYGEGLNGIRLNLTGSDRGNRNDLLAREAQGNVLVTLLSYCESHNFYPHIGCSRDGLEKRTRYSCHLYQAGITAALVGWGWSALEALSASLLAYHAKKPKPAS